MDTLVVEIEESLLLYYGQDGIQVQSLVSQLQSKT